MNPPKSTPPLHTQNPLDRFSSRAQDYAKYRPSYPSEAIDTILGSGTNLTIADIGAGTGISSRLLADRGATVWAIEPNAAMRSEAQPHPQVTYREGTAEQTGLPDRAVDIVTCCQSFHWFEPLATLQEFHRILKTSGRVALMWNDRNLEDEFTRQYSDIVNAASEKGIFDNIDRKSSAALQTTSWFTHYRAHTFSATHELDRDSLIGLVMSASYAPQSGAAYDQLMIDLEALYDRGKDAIGKVTLTYQIKLYLADKVN